MIAFEYRIIFMLTFSNENMRFITFQQFQSRRLLADSPSLQNLKSPLVLLSKRLYLYLILWCTRQIHQHREQVGFVSHLLNLQKKRKYQAGNFNKSVYTAKQNNSPKMILLGASSM